MHQLNLTPRLMYCRLLDAHQNEEELLPEEEEDEEDEHEVSLLHGVTELCTFDRNGVQYISCMSSK